MLLYRMLTVKEGSRLRRRSSVIKARVNESAPTGLAMVLNPQAAMSSVMPCPSSVFAVPEAQQSRMMRTSDRASSRVFCIPPHFTCRKALSCRFWTLNIVSKYIGHCVNLLHTLPKPAGGLLSTARGQRNTQSSDHVCCPLQPQ